MICKLCHKNETESTSWICWECIGGGIGFGKINMTDKAYTNLKIPDKEKQKLRFLAGGCSDWNTKLKTL